MAWEMIARVKETGFPIHGGFKMTIGHFMAPSCYFKHEKKGRSVGGKAIERLRHQKARDNATRNQKY